MVSIFQWMGGKPIKVEFSRPALINRRVRFYYLEQNLGRRYFVLFVLFLSAGILPSLVTAAIQENTPAPMAETTVDENILQWESEVASLEKKDRTAAPIPNSIVFYGSSSIRRWESMADDLAPWPTVRRGYGGAKLPDVIYFAPRVIGPHLGADNPRRCRAVVLFVANDISNNPEKDATSEEVASRFATLHLWIRKQDATVPIFWIEVTPCRSRWLAWPKIHDSTHRIRTLLDADENSHLVATAGAFLGLDGTPRSELFVDDQLHLNAAGYRLWSALIKAQLDSRLGPAIPFEMIQPNDNVPAPNVIH